MRLIERFYTAFDNGDVDTMVACYTPDIHFWDPIFPDLRGERVGALWRMLTSVPGELRVELCKHEADASEGWAHWKAHYTPSATGRRLIFNSVFANFLFKDGLIVEHYDSFRLDSWSRENIGPVGMLLGPALLKSTIRKRAAAMLTTQGGGTVLNGEAWTA